MKVMVTSWRGHHEAVMEPEVAQAVFQKMTGQRTKALEPELKVKVPDTFHELQALWNDGKSGYTAFTKQNGDLVQVKDFDPAVEDLLFIAPIAGG